MSRLPQRDSITTLGEQFANDRSALIDEFKLREHNFDAIELFLSFPITILLLAWSRLKFFIAFDRNYG